MVIDARAWKFRTALRAFGGGTFGLLLGACSESGPAGKSIPVLIRFENVRKDASLDEWAAIEHVLNGHSSEPVKPRFSRPRKVSGSDLRDVSVVVTVENFAVLDKINQEIVEMSTTKVGGDTTWLSSLGLDSKSGGQTIDFALSDAALSYESAFVTSAVAITVTGQTTRNNVVKLYLQPGQPPLALSANGSGAWSTRVQVLPETRHIYGSSEDPRGRTRTKYFRINLSTLRHENIAEEEFLKATEE